MEHQDEDGRQRMENLLEEVPSAPEPRASRIARAGAEIRRVVTR